MTNRTKTTKVGKDNHRHGDVDIVCVASLPKDAVKISSVATYTAAEGEITGHSHKVDVLRRGAKLEVWEQGGMRFLIVPSGGATITHQEHHEQTINPGIYKISIETEYDPFTQELKQVRD
jgi:hypothetical protein